MGTSVVSTDLIQQLCLVSITGILCMIGLMIQTFMVVVSVIDRLKGRPLTPADLLITSIATSRIIFHFLSLLFLLWITFNQTFSTTFLIVVGILDISSTNCNIWLSALLSVFYSLKISNFYNVFFLYLKKIISQRLLRVIVVSVLLSIGCSSVEVMMEYVDLRKNSTIHNVQRRTFKVLLFLVWNFIPFLFYVISLFPLLGSLCRHMYRMR
ncbi:hypothetical protein GDO81_023252, partial [Engystomops pustulosus]